MYTIKNHAYIIFYAWETPKCKNPKAYMII